MLYGIKEVWYKKNNMLIPINKGGVITSGGFRRVSAMYIDIKTINATIKFNLKIGGSHPNPSPHIRMAISNKYFEYKQNYGNYVIDFISATNITSIKSTSSGTHDVTIEATNMPVPSIISLVQNTIERHSTSNYLYTYVNDEMTNTLFWADDTLIAISMEPENYSPTPVLKLDVDPNTGKITYERLIP